MSLCGLQGDGEIPFNVARGSDRSCQLMTGKAIFVNLNNLHTQSVPVSSHKTYVTMKILNVEIVCSKQYKYFNLCEFVGQVRQGLFDRLAATCIVRSSGRGSVGN